MHYVLTKAPSVNKLLHKGIILECIRLHFLSMTEWGLIQ